MDLPMTPIPIQPTLVCATLVSFMPLLRSPGSRRFAPSACSRYIFSSGGSESPSFITGPSPGAVQRTAFLITVRISFW